MKAKTVKYLAEAVIAHMFFFVMRVLPLDTASNFGAWIGRVAGPRLSSSRVALDNIARAFPDMDSAQARLILIGMWENLGRIMAEYPHLGRISRERITIENGALVEQLKNDQQPAVIFAGHIGNWEVPPVATLIRHQFPVSVIYRAPNNPFVDQLLQRLRSRGGKIDTIPKSFVGARDMVRALKDGRHLAILIDQKYNEGIAVPFLGRPAMTSPAFVQLAQKFNCPLVPIHIRRERGAYFHMRVYPPLPHHNENGAQLPVEEVIASAHILLEDWIRQAPEQWLWLHRRWPRD